MIETNRHTLLDVREHLQPEPRVHYIDHSFIVPEDASLVGLTFTFHKEKLAQLFVSLHSPDGFRGNRMNPGAKGNVELVLWVSPNDASEGAIPGALTAGEWFVRVDVEALGEETDYHLIVYAEHGEITDPITLDFSDAPVIRDEPGWYRGELHAHSTESDGKYAVETVVEAAIDTQLDFFALTDHFTVSQWRKLQPYTKHLALLHSCEITSHHGHANVHGMKDWVDVYVDRDDWTMNDAADQIHEQDGLFCVNHPFSGRLGWRAYDFDWHRADLMEVYHNLEAINNTYQVGLWDRLLSAGYRIVGVAGIDSHDPFEGRHKLGQLYTYVYCDELSQAGVIHGLKRGQVYLSKGPQLRFFVSSADATASMWETLTTSGAINIQAEIMTTETLRLFVFKNGLFFDSVIVEGAADLWQTITFTDYVESDVYYRVELHALQQHPDHTFMQWRDHTTFRAMSNPVWVKGDEAR